MTSDEGGVTKAVELFAGVGGFRLGLERNNIRVIWANEWDKYAADIYDKNFGGKISRDSITDVRAEDIPKHDLICGGFPCQAFSVAGKRKGFDETRGTLFFEIMRIAQYHRTPYLFLENVKGLLSHDGGRTFETILESLQELGYYSTYEVYNSKDFGVPQNRERVFLNCTHIGVLAGQPKKTSILKTTIESFLYQSLLNNLTAAQRLQDHASKDWVVAYLVLNEMNQNLSPSDENIKAGIMTAMVGGLFQLPEEEVWQSIDTSLKWIWEEGYLGKNKYTISTAIKEITNWRTFTYSQMLLAILTLTVHLRNSSKSLWSEVLSNLIVIQEGTNYARINEREQKNPFKENRAGNDTSCYPNWRNDQFIGHLRGQPRPKVFPLGEVNQVYSEPRGESGQTGGADANEQYIVERTPLRFLDRNQKNIEGDYAFTVDTSNTGGIKYLGSLNPNTRKGTEGQEHLSRAHKQPARVHDSSGINPALSAGETQGRYHTQHAGRIRRLTPLECERLQGFPDRWTEGGVSDTQRYKMMGNAVTVNVIEAIAEVLK